MLNRSLFVSLVGAAALFLTPSLATAQESNIDTIDGPNVGEETTLMVSPRPLTEEISARALGIQGPNSTRWAITLIGIGSADSLKLTMGDQTLPIEDISRPEEGEVGPTRLYLSQETFLTIAETDAVRLHVGSVTTGLPERMREEMRLIRGEVV